MIVIGGPRIFGGIKIRFLPPGQRIESFAKTKNSMGKIIITPHLLHHWNCHSYSTVHFITISNVGHDTLQCNDISNKNESSSTNSSISGHSHVFFLIYVPALFPTMFLKKSIFFSIHGRLPIALVASLLHAPNKNPQCSTRCSGGTERPQRGNPNHARFHEAVTEILKWKKNTFMGIIFSWTGCFVIHFCM